MRGYYSSTRYSVCIYLTITSLHGNATDRTIFIVSDDPEIAVEEKVTNMT